MLPKKWLDPPGLGVLTRSFSFHRDGQTLKERFYTDWEVDGAPAIRPLSGFVATIDCELKTSGVGSEESFIWISI